MKNLKMNLDDVQRLAKERTVRTQTIEYDLETLVKKINKGVIKLNPEYQRRHRWNPSTASRLIESLILNIPVPFIYISQDIDVDEEVEDDVARYSVIDGQQRLTAISDFINKKFELESLEVLETLNGCYYNDLPPFLIRRLEERSIKCLRIDSTIDQQVKYDIFERLNSGSVKLEAQELRNATCRRPFKDLISKLAKDKNFMSFCNLTPTSARVKKMEDVELVLRYFSLNWKMGFTEYKGGFKSFLTENMEKFNKLESKDLNAMKTEFIQIINLIQASNIALPFSKFKVENKKLKKMSSFNAAVFDAVTCYTKACLTKKSQPDLNKFKNLFFDEEFFAACEGSVNDVSKVTTRLRKAEALA